MVLVTGGIAIAAIASLCCIMVWPIRIRYREWGWGRQGGPGMWLEALGAPCPVPAWAKVRVSFQMSPAAGRRREPCPSVGCCGRAGSGDARGPAHGGTLMVGTRGRAAILLLPLLAPELGAAPACCVLLEGRIHPCDGHADPGTPWVTEGWRGLLHVLVAKCGGRGWGQGLGTGCPLPGRGPRHHCSAAASALQGAHVLLWGGGRGRTPPALPWGRARAPRASGRRV